MKQNFAVCAFLLLFSSFQTQAQQQLFGYSGAAINCENDFNGLLIPKSNIDQFTGPRLPDPDTSNLVYLYECTYEATTGGDNPEFAQRHVKVYSSGERLNIFVFVVLEIKNPLKSATTGFLRDRVNVDVVPGNCFAASISVQGVPTPTTACIAEDGTSVTFAGDAFRVPDLLVVQSL